MGMDEEKHLGPGHALLKCRGQVMSWYFIVLAYCAPDFAEIIETLQGFDHNPNKKHYKTAEYGGFYFF